MNENRKRITMKLKTPNPLFEKWITEWRDKAREKNSKMEYCFNKALESLKKYPLPMESGKDCKILIGFGDKICQMLDDRLKEYKKDQGDNLDDTIIGNYHNPDENELSKPKKKKTTKPVKSPRTNPSPSKEYVPKESSGGYAILLTLYRKGLEPSYPGYLSKLELVREAQHLSDKSFTKPDPGTRYTAWSSMKTLVSKKLVKKVSNPGKFSLTDEGLLLAKRLYDKRKSIDLSNNTNTSNFGDEKNDVVIDLTDEEVVPETNTAPLNTMSTFDAKSSALSFKNNIGENIVVSQSQNCKTIQRFDSASSVMSANLQKDIADLWEQELMSETQSSASSSSIVPLSSKSSAKSSFRSYSEDNVVISRTKSCKTLEKHASSASVASSTQSSLQEETVIFSPNTFDIILYVDKCETGGSNMDIRDDPILAELNYLSVPYEVKNLKVGDYTWICRDRVTKHELVLPYVIERKRMDDFGKSIKDGRYHEQKFRLKKCGIQNVVYLIESYGKNEHVGLPVATLYQAATNTAIQDGFCIKLTENYKNTAKYLANFTTLLVKMFKAKTLVSCPKETLPKASLDDDLVSLMTFKEFNRSSSKNKPLYVSDLFVKMLIQINGMSVDRALAIVREYPTPDVLRRAYEKNPGAKGEKLLSSIQFGDSKKAIGQVLSKIVYQLFTVQTF